MKNNILLIEDLANKARLWAEEYAKSDTDVFSNKLDSMCAIASSYLSSQLTNNDIRNHIALYEGVGFAHCFIVTDHYLIDITATQFNYKTHPNPAKSIEIHSLGENNLDIEFWKISKLFKNSNQLLHYQIKNDWPIEQRIDRDKALLKLCIPILPVKNSTLNI